MPMTCSSPFESLQMSLCKPSWPEWKGNAGKQKNCMDAEFTLDKMDNELVCMTLLRALPDEYSSFASSLQMLDKLEKAKIQEAFVAEELLRNRSNNSRDAPSGALTASALAINTLPLLSLASSACSQITPSLPAITTRLPKSQQCRTQRTRPRSDTQTVPEVAKALRTPLRNRTPLLLLLQCRNLRVKQVFVPTRPSNRLSSLLTHSGLQTQVPLLI